MVNKNNLTKKQKKIKEVFKNHKEQMTWDEIEKIFKDL